jgi:hypothetical protein
MYRAFRIGAAAALVAVAACSAGDPARNAVAPSREGESLPPAPEATPIRAATTPAADAEPEDGNGMANATVGGDGSPIRLSSLRSDDAAGLSGELGCAFTAERQEGALLIARADVGKAERAEAVVRNGDSVERLVSRTEGGFGAVEKQARFGGRGLTIDIARTTRVPTGSEETRYRATLAVHRGDGAERRYQGFWNCGP